MAVWQLEQTKRMESAAAGVELGDMVDAGSRESIGRLMREVEAAVESREVQRLKKANGALDEGTQHIATLLIERAMEESLKRKGIL